MLLGTGDFICKAKHMDGPLYLAFRKLRLFVINNSDIKNIFGKINFIEGEGFQPFGLWHKLFGFDLAYEPKYLEYQSALTGNNEELIEI